MAKHRTADPFMPAAVYGRALPAFSLNLIVRDVPRSAAWHRDVLGADLRYADPDFAALRAGATDYMLHADHTYEGHPWAALLASPAARGLGAEIRLFQADPDAVERAAREHGGLLAPAVDKPHGWREVWVQDPDGYVWAVGSPIGD